ncbi:MAG: hypothetical protein ACRDRX_11235 [Pseudonocardiaceae bacterium]
MTSTSASSQFGFRPADALRRALYSVFGRHSRAPGPELPDSPDRIAGLVPEMPEALEWMESRITALADRGKLDAEHGGILDPAVETMVELWARGLNAEHRAHQARLKRAELDLSARVSWLQREADLADARIAALNNELTTRSPVPQEPQPEEPQPDEPQPDEPHEPEEAT